MIVEFESIKNKKLNYVLIEVDFKFLNLNLKTIVDTLKENYNIKLTDDLQVSYKKSKIHLKDETFLIADLKKGTLELKNLKEGILFANLLVRKRYKIKYNKPKNLEYND